MKKLLASLSLFVACICALAQSTTVSSTGVVDTDSSVWIGATYTVNFVPALNVPNISSYSWSGGTLLPTYSGTLAGTYLCVVNNSN